MPAPHAVEHSDSSNTACVLYFNYEKATHSSDQPLAIKQDTYGLKLLAIDIN